MFRLSGAQLRTVMVIVAVTAACVLYRAIEHQRLGQTALLFMGVPALLAILTAIQPPAKTATGGILRVTVIVLLLSGPLLNEGFICILLASPLFLLVGVVIGAIIDASRRRRRSLMCIAIVAIPLSLEGTSPKLSFPRHETVTVTRVVPGSADAVGRAMARSLRLDAKVPLFGRLGFPLPVEARGSGLEPGATRTIRFAGGEGDPGDLVMRVTASGPGMAEFEGVEDHSKIAAWMGWDTAEARWSTVDEGHTRVTWTLHVTRRLDPAWYFRPFERYGVRVAAEYLIAANATPAPGE